MAASDNVLDHDDTRLRERDEVLFRQVHPKQMDGDIPGSGAFKPSTNDEGRMSVDRSSITSPEGSFTLHTESKGLQSQGVWGVSVGEFESKDVVCHADPIAESDHDPANPAHALANFGQQTKSAIRKTALALKEFALTRGRFHPEE